MNTLSAQSVLIYSLPLDFSLALTSCIVSSVALEENEKTNTTLASLSCYICCLSFIVPITFYQFPSSRNKVFS